MRQNAVDRLAEAGLTLLELLVVVVVAVPILGSVLATNRMVREENTAIETAADAAESCRIAGQRLALYARAGLLSTCEVKATQQDVDWATDAHTLDPSVVIPAIGDWISPYEPEDGENPDPYKRSTFRFQAADGVLSLNATALTPAREFEFVLDDNEIANNIDDDGDGMIDEGSLQLRIGSTRIELIATGVEKCLFLLQDHILQLELKCARRDHQGHIYESSATHQVYMRNN